jgi:hypothetical protein
MSNAARRFVGDAGERGTAPSPDRGRGAGIANKEENGCSNTAAGGVAVSSRERNDLTTAIQAPRRYFETSLTVFEILLVVEPIWAIRNFPGGGVTLRPEQGEPGADFSRLGPYNTSKESRLACSQLPTTATTNSLSIFCFYSRYPFFSIS